MLNIIQKTTGCYLYYVNPPNVYIVQYIYTVHEKHRLQYAITITFNNLTACTCVHKSFFIKLHLLLCTVVVNYDCIYYR